MSEQSQLAKLRRRALSYLARRFGEKMLGYFSLSLAEKAALALRKIPATKNSETLTTTFAIPLVGAHQVADWSVIEQTLARTLKGLIAQSNPNWRAVICSQTRPAAVDLDSRISHLEFSTLERGHDKVAKLKSLSAHCLQDQSNPGFFMPLDGDDLLHSHFVQTLHDCPEHGLLVCGGYIVNASNGHVGETRSRTLNDPVQKPFWKFCGSCMALPSGNNNDAESRFFDALANHEHRLYPYLAELAGFELRKPSQPLALYVINHGENFETRRGRGGFKQRFVEHFRVTDPAQLQSISENFSGSDSLISSNKADP